MNEWTWRKLRRTRVRTRIAIEMLAGNALPLAERYHPSFGAELRDEIARLRQRHAVLDATCSAVVVVSLDAPPHDLVDAARGLARDICDVCERFSAPAQAERQRARMHVMGERT